MALPKGGPPPPAHVVKALHAKLIQAGAQFDAAGISLANHLLAEMLGGGSR